MMFLYPVQTWPHLAESVPVSTFKVPRILLWVLSIQYSVLSAAPDSCAQESGASTNVLCMHKILVHAQDPCACNKFWCMHQIRVH